MKKLPVKITFLVSVFILMLACEKDNETKISSHESSDSHKDGQNCMNCHKQGGSGEGWFILAGTVYNKQKVSTYSNATIKLYTGAESTGILKNTIQGDALGNFYTTEKIDFGSGLYVSVEGEIDIKYMSEKVTGGQCNSCHGGATDKIWTE